MAKVALVTGTSSGIGRAVAEVLAERGYEVFATALPSQRDIAPAKNTRSIELDVTDEASVEGCVRAVMEQAGRIDVLVNNAGYVLLGALEETSIEEAKRQFDTNFFGAYRMTRSVLPIMRAQEYGRVVTISSLLGVLPAPFMGLYGATKHALECFSESLDHEARLLGVKAILIQPYWTNTDIIANSKQAQSSLDVHAGVRAGVFETFKKEMERHGNDPRVVAEVVHAAVTAKNPRLRYAVGRSAFISRMRRILPEAIFDRSFRRRSGLP